MRLDISRNPTPLALGQTRFAEGTVRDELWALLLAVVASMRSQITRLGHSLDPTQNNSTSHETGSHRTRIQPVIDATAHARSFEALNDVQILRSVTGFRPAIHIILNSPAPYWCDLVSVCVSPFKVNDFSAVCTVCKQRNPVLKLPVNLQRPKVPAARRYLLTSSRRLPLQEVRG
jgi:hypothetical protein